MIYFTAIFFAILSIIFGMLGIGGGVVYTPFQLFTGTEYDTAATISLFLITVTGLSSAFIYKKASLIDLKLVAVMETFTVSGSFSGGFFSHLIPDNFKTWLFSIVLVLAALTMLFFSEEKIRKTIAPKFYHWKRVYDDKEIYVNIIILVIASFFAGAFSGILGIGGGIFKIPVMIVLLGLPTKVAFASSSLMVGITGFGGFTGRIFHSVINWKATLLYAAAVMVGSFVGAKISVKTNKEKLRKLFAYFLIAIAVVTFVKNFV